MIPDPLIGQQLGDYTVISLLGRGGMARVYKGYDARLERFAAVKVIDAQLINSGDAEEYRQRFHREARSIARLRHAHIVNVYQFGEYGNLYYMAMVFVEGRDLGNILRQHAQQKTRLGYGQVIRIARDIAEALDYAHREGVIHRDIKPSNIMVMSDGHAILTDFGLALSVPEGSMGNTFGSAHYIAPEQAVASNNAVPQSDMYSLGVVIYQMLAGKVPFDDPSAMSVAIKHLQEPPPPPTIYNPDLPSTAEAVMLKALSKKPEGRYPNGVALVNALENALRLGGRSVEYGNNDPTVERVAVMPPPPAANLDSSSTMMLPPSDPANHDKPVPVIKPLGSSKPETPAQPSSPARTSPPSPLSVYREGESEAVKPSSSTNPTGEGLSAAPVISSPPASLESPSLYTERGLGGEVKNRRLPLLIGAAVVAVGIVAALLLSGGSLNAVTPSPTPRATIDALAAVSSLQPPTQEQPPTATDAPTDVATLQPTDAPTTEPMTLPTDAPSAEPTTANPTATVAAGEGDLQLRYDGTMITLTNTSHAAVNLSDVEFAQSMPDGTERVFRANQWSSGEFNINRLRAGDCLQVLTDALVASDAPDDCTRQSWRSVSRPRWFWVSSADDATFIVRRGDAVLATCPIAAGECRFSVS
jgi:serine/threonine protein kinase